MLTIHVWPKWLKEFLLTHPLYKSPGSFLLNPVMVEPPQKHLFAMPVARPLATFAPRKLLASLVGQPDRLRRQANVFRAARWSDGVFDIGMRTLA